MPPNLGGEVRQARAFKEDQEAEDRLGFAPMRGRLLTQDLNGQAGIEVQLIQ
jgi:hypothetical protein